MKTQFEYMYFVELRPKAKTRVFSCRQQRRSGHEIGRVQWYAPWRQYCYFPMPSVYSAGCLRDILVFLDQANAEHRRGAGR